jgi:enolase
MQAIENAGHTGKIKLAIDAAASEFYKDGKYILAGDNKTLTANELTEVYASRVEKYPLISIEDSHGEDDFE